MTKKKSWKSYYKKISGKDQAFLLKGAMTMLSRKHFEDAVFLFKGVLELSPNSFEALSGIVIALHQLGDIKDSIKFARHAIEIAPSSIYIHEIMAACLYESGRVQEAIECVNNILNIDPTSQTAISLLILFESDVFCFDHVPQKPAAGNSVVLVNSPYWLIGAPNCGLGYIAEALRKENISFTLLDLNRIFYESLPAKHRAMLRPETMVTWYDHGFFRILELKLQGFIEASAQWITENGIVTGFSAALTSRNFSLALAKTIKNISANFPVIFGGYDCIRPQPCENYSSNVDAFIIGEGEKSFPLLVKTYIEDVKKGINTAKQIAGVMYASGAYTPRQPCDVNKLAFPTYKELNLDTYVNENGVKTIAISSSRGCVWGHCTFCSITRTSFRQRTPESIYQEIRYHHLQNGVSNFIFSDVQAGGTAENIITLAELIANDSEIRVTLEGQIRFSRALTKPKAFETLKKAGFNYIQFGLESGSAKILQKMKKGISLRLAKDVLRACKMAGISPGIFIIVGFPGETEDDHAATLVFLEEMADVIEQIETVNTFIAAYGSPYWQELDNDGVVCDEFSGVIVGDWIDGENTPELREKRRREVMDKAAAIKINTGLFIKDGASMELVRFFWERGETERAEQVLRRIGESNAECQVLDRPTTDIADPETSLRQMQKCLRAGEVNEAMRILEKQQEEKPCFHIDFHLASEIVYKKAGISYVNSPLFKLLSEKFYSHIKQVINPELSGKCLVVGTSFQYHILLVMRALEELKDVSLLVKDKEMSFFSSLLDSPYIIGFNQKNINRNMVKENKTINSMLAEGKLLDTIIILQNQSPQGAYKNVIEFCQELKPEKIFTVTWDAKAEILNKRTHGQSA